MRRWLHIAAVGEPPTREPETPLEVIERAQAVMADTDPYVEEWMATGESVPPELLHAAGHLTGEVIAAGLRLHEEVERLTRDRDAADACEREAENPRSSRSSAPMYFAVSLHGEAEGAGEMTDIDTMLAEVKRLDAEATPGEWQWYGNTDSQSCYLATVHSGRIYVLDFDRWGMQDAQPRFRWPVGANAGIMYSLAKMPSECGPRFEVEYRRDFVGINHPDAELITHYRTAAPLLAAEVERLRAEVERLTRDRDAAESYARASMAESLDATRAIAAQRDAALTERDEARRELAAAEESARMYAERSLRWEREADQARRELGECREVLEDVEWSGRDVDNELPCCPSCGGIEPGTRNRWAGQHSGHTADCALAAALGKEQGNGRDGGGCDTFERGAPSGDCEGDGHYECRECRLHSAKGERT